MIDLLVALACGGGWGGGGGGDEKTETAPPAAAKREQARWKGLLNAEEWNIGILIKKKF